VAATAVAALLVAGVVIVLATRDSGSDGDSGDSAGSAASVETTGDSADTTTGGGASDVQVGDDVGLNPPDGLQFSPMPTSDLEAVRDVTAGSVGDSLDLVAGSLLVDDQNSTKGSLVLFQSGSGTLDEADAQAIIAAVVDEESVTEHADLTVNGITGQRFTRDDGSVGWIGSVHGAAVLMVLAAEDAESLEQHLRSLAVNNPDVTETTTATTGRTSQTTSTGDIADITLGNLNSVEPTINPPSGFTFRALVDAEIEQLQGARDQVAPTTRALSSVLGSPFVADGSGVIPGGIILYVGDGTATFQQDVIDALLADGTEPRSLDVGQFVGTSYTQGDGSQGWVGRYHGAVMDMGLVQGQDQQAFLSGLDAANS
jgi:hypothetical protein